ncbi:GNAT family N-acetyltransferase [Eubacterium limosum]|uniref:GNAT family N-acetyltransferase n=1 Tax=Eubacterium limosum TaxID=1736 RepID=UPI003715DB86
MSNNTEKITKKNLLRFIHQIDRVFPIPLSDKVNLEDYTEKLLKNAVICAEFDNEQIIGVVAGYINDISSIAYISLVAVLPQARGEGVASKLIKEFFEKCREKAYIAVHVYTHKTNHLAIRMYEKLGFKKYEIKNEPRPEDEHFIYDFSSKCAIH